MTLRRYDDPGVIEEVEPDPGTYLASYATDENLVAVHLFDGADGDLVVFVTKVPGVPIVDAQAVAHEAAAEYARDRGRPAGRERLVYDSSIFAGTGRL